MLFGPAGSSVWGPCLGLSLGPSLAQLTPSHRKATRHCRTEAHSPLRCRLRGPVLPGGGWEVGRKGRLGPVPSVFLSTLTHPSKTVSSLQDALLTALCVCLAETLVFGKKKDHFIRKILLDHEHFGPKLWAGWL